MKGSKDIERTTLGLQTDRPTVAKQYALFFKEGIKSCLKKFLYNWVFFHGCKFLQFVSKICADNFCNFPLWQIWCLFYWWYVKTSCQLWTPRFCIVLCIYFEDIDPSKQKLLFFTHLCVSYDQKLITVVQEWSKLLVHTLLDLNSVRMDCVYLTTVMELWLLNFSELSGEREEICNFLSPYPTDATYQNW